MIKNADGYNDPTVDRVFSNVLKKTMSEQDAKSLSRIKHLMSIVRLLAVWLVFCLGAGLSLVVVFGVTSYNRRRNCKWLQEIQRIEDEDQAKALRRRK